MNEYNLNIKFKKLLVLNIKYIDSHEQRSWVNYSKAAVTAKIASESTDKTGKSDCLAQHNGLTLFSIVLKYN